MDKLHQKGFTTVEAVLVLVVIGIIGGTGYFVWHAKHNADASLDAASNSKQASITAKKKADTKQAGLTDETASWVLFESKGEEYTIRIADGWVVEENYYGTGLETFDNDALAYKAGTKAVLRAFPGGRDGDSGLFINYATENIDQIVTPSEKQASLKTTDDVEVEKYYGDVVSGGIGDQTGYKQYTYIIRKSSNRVISVNYIYGPDMVDYHSVIEKVIVTAHFN